MSVPPKTVVRKSFIASKLGAKTAQSANPRAGVSSKLNLNQTLKKRQNIALPHSELHNSLVFQKRIVSTFSAGDYGQIEELPKLSEVDDSTFNDLFRKMLNQCKIKCNFGDDLLDIKNKQLKTKYLEDILEQTASGSFYKKADALSIRELFVMLKSNILRYTPPIPDLAKVPLVGDDICDTVMEASWPHLELVYNIFQKFLESPFMDAKACVENIDEKFIHRFLQLFNSPDARERSILKLVLHRLYLRFVQHRTQIRRTIQHIFYTFLFETKYFNGINELLEIMVSIINGYTVPLKAEHLVFFRSILIPLHSSDFYYLFQDNLTMCIAQYLQKDTSLVVDFFKGLLSQWPVCSTVKELLFIEQIDHLIEVITDEQFDEIKVPLFVKLSQLVTSESFRVAEAAMLLWKNDRFVDLAYINSSSLIPIITPSLYQAGMKHWNSSIKNLAVSVIKICMESIDQADQDNFNNTIKANQELADQKLQMKKTVWLAIENKAMENDPSIKV